MRCLLLGSQKGFAVAAGTTTTVRMAPGAFHLRVSDACRLIVGTGDAGPAAFALDPEQDVAIRLVPGESLSFSAPISDVLVWVTPLDDGIGA
jgi:hypothetical protein